MVSDSDGRRAAGGGATAANCAGSESYDLESRLFPARLRQEVAGLSRAAHQLRTGGETHRTIRGRQLLEEPLVHLTKDVLFLVPAVASPRLERPLRHRFSERLVFE